jgi:hypothetical protein
MLAFGPLLVGSYLVMVADGIPTFDVKQTCRGTEVAAIFPGRNMETCIQSEQSALEQLRKAWAGFAAPDRAECVGLARMSGPPSYVELITCLEMRRDMRRIRATSPDAPEQTGTTNSRRKTR